MENEIESILSSIYESMCKELAERHSRWVNQNFALRGLELAKTQIESKGDTSVDYAELLMQKAHDRLSAINRKECDELYAYDRFVCGFVRKAEDIANVKLDGKMREDAMNAKDNPRKLPPIPSNLDF